MKLILLPGMDGTGELFAPIVPYLSSAYEVEILSYPRDKFLDYEALIAYVKERLPTTEAYLLLAESFSGYIAYQIAREKPEGLKRVIFVSTFLESPRPRLGKLLPFVPMQRIFGWKIPRAVIKRLLVCTDTGEATVTLVQRCIATVPPEILYQRLQAVVQLQHPQEPITLPGTYLQASHDCLIPRDAFDLFVGLVPRIRYHEARGGHLLLQSNPKACAKIINECISEDRE